MFILRKYQGYYKDAASGSIKYPRARLSRFPLKGSIGKVHNYY